MSQSMAETLRSTATTAQKKAARAEAARLRKEKREEAAALRLREERITDFVGELLTSSIEEVMNTTNESAARGEDTATKQWVVKRGERDPEPTEEIEKYQALREKVAEHFVDLGLSTRNYDYRKGYTDRTGPSDEGWWPYIQTDHVIALELSWAEEQTGN